MGNQLKQEVDELKEALRQYQNEFENEKQNLHQQLRDVNEDKYKIHVEKEKAEIALKKQLSALGTEMEELLADHQKRMALAERESREREEALKTLMENKEEQAHQQIRYLTKRYKELG